MTLLGFDVLADQLLGEGGFLRLRRLRLRGVRADGSRTGEGTYDFVERPMGPDAVVVVIWCREASGAPSVLLRAGARVPLHFRGGTSTQGLQFPEVVAGILEAGEDGPEAQVRRAVDEVDEEAGLRVPASRLLRLGPPGFPTPGMCAELFHLFSCEVTAEERGRARPPEGDGSPFEEGATLEWVPLQEALQRCRGGSIADFKTELGLRRLAEALA